MNKRLSVFGLAYIKLFILEKILKNYKNAFADFFLKYLKKIKRRMFYFF